jgi:hypothetical protein
LRNSNGFDETNPSDEYKESIVSENDAYVEFLDAQSELHNLFLGSVKMQKTISDNYKKEEKVTNSTGVNSKSVAMLCRDYFDTLLSKGIDCDAAFDSLVKDGGFKKDNGEPIERKAMYNTINFGYEGGFSNLRAGIIKRLK